MKRWHMENIFDIGKKLFAKTHKQKFHANHNRKCNTDGRRLGISRKDQTLFFSLVTWWVTSSNTWQYHELLQFFINACWHESVSAYAAALYHHHITSLCKLKALDAGVALSA